VLKGYENSYTRFFENDFNINMQTNKKDTLLYTFQLALSI